jgi:hypothetical protein
MKLLVHRSQRGPIHGQLFRSGLPFQEEEKVDSLICVDFL